MAEREIIFVDANTIWHRRLAEAFGRIRPTIAFEPSAGLLPGLVGTDVRAGQTTFMSVKLVRGWASKTAFYGQRQLAARIVRAAHDLGVSPVVVLTSPKYRLLASLLSPRFPLVYYCADDYREYEGWGGLRIAEAESEIVRSVQLSVFVSNALRQRAVKEYAVPEDRTFTSPNATEPRFLACAPTADPGGILPQLKRPVVGMLGALTERLDLPLIRRVADLETVGTLLIAGHVDESLRSRNDWIFDNPKILATGRLPHAAMHRYALALDAALIPYTRKALNHFCSPMRLYDHLASGIPIFATDACDQINRLNIDGLVVAPTSELPGIASDVLRNLAAGRRRKPAEMPEGLLWSDRAARLATAIDGL